MFKRLFSLPVFILSLILGLLFIYLSESEKEVVYVYPTPYNLDKVEYKDSVGNCFDFSADKLKCPDDNTLIKKIPIQTTSNNN
jgi:hypothetical protein|tara:strand:+ start:266 stop:514 length:249 start_codon:yes stop_codon:yes gene_type:complete